MKGILPLVVLVAGVHIWSTAAGDCPCPSPEQCNYVSEDPGIHNEIYAFNNGSIDVHLWHWESITTFVAPTFFDIKNSHQAHTMCTAHKRGRKFGITVDMDLSGDIDEKSEAAEKWVSSAVAKQKAWNADVIVVNLMPYFSSDFGSSTDDHISLIKILINMHETISNLTGISVKISCITPWKPPCSEDQQCAFLELSQHACDFYVLNAESFTDVSRTKCRAQATIPFSSLLYGIAEYNSHHIPMSRIILSIPWHGYDYPCQKYENDICFIQETTTSNGSKCHFDDRKALSYGEINHHLDISKVQQSELYNAPYLIYKDGSVTHEVWFENHHSLLSKYKLVHELGLKGLGIMYGDDLAPTSTARMLINEESMWSWVGHEIILTASKTPIRNPLHYADMVAGVGVGCLVLGTLLGVVFTFIALRNRVKKPKQPFLRDGDANIDEYTDEDPNL